MHDRFDDGGQGAFGADDQFREVEVGAGKPRHIALANLAGKRRHRQVEPALGHEFIQVVAAHAAHDLGKTGRDLLALARDDLRDTAMDLSPKSRTVLRRLQFAVSQRPQGGTRAVAQVHIQRLHMIDGLSIPNGAGTGRIIADHAPQVGAVARRHVGPELQAMPRRRRVQLIEHDAGLNARGARLHVDFQNLVEVPAEIDDQAGPDRLAGQTRPSAARNQRQLELPGNFNGHGNIFARGRQNDARRLDLVDASVGAVEGAVIRIEQCAAGEASVERLCQLFRLCG